MLIQCHDCGICADTEEDILDVQEWLIYEDTAGYGSIYIGDMNTWKIVLCQNCILHNLGELIKIKE